MVNFAIVEDNKADSDTLKNYLVKYCEENSAAYHISVAYNGMEFLEELQKNPNFDVVFLDIDMPMLNGMECARRLRGMGSNCCILFVTNMMKYAIQGYEVDAKGYVLKPISYAKFSREMNRVFAILNARSRDDGHIAINTAEGKRVLVYSSIKYIEVKGHNSIIYTEQGEFVIRKALGEIEKPPAEPLPELFFCSLGLFSCSLGQLY